MGLRHILLCMLSIFCSATWAFETGADQTTLVSISHWFFYLLFVITAIYIFWIKSAEIQTRLCQYILRSSLLLLLFVPLQPSAAPFLLTVCLSLPFDVNGLRLYVWFAPIIFIGVVLSDRGLLPKFLFSKNHSRKTA